MDLNNPNSETNKDPYYKPFVLLLTANIPCVSWSNVPEFYHRKRGGHFTIGGPTILVRDIDEAVDELTRHGFTVRPKRKRCVFIGLDTRLLSAPHCSLKPPLEGVWSNLVSPVVLWLDKTWGFDVNRHHQQYPSHHPKWIWPPFVAYLNSTITAVLDCDGPDWDLLICQLSMNLDWSYNPCAPGMRDLTDQLSYENRQYHIDRCYGLCGYWWRDYQEYACKVYKQLRAGTRGLRDPVAEYEARAAEFGIPLVDSCEYGPPLAPAERRTKLYVQRKRSRKYHVARIPPVEVVGHASAVCEQLHNRWPGKREATPEFWAWAAQLGLTPSWIEEWNPHWEHPAGINRAHRVCKLLHRITTPEAGPCWTSDI
jgi:hypothetical protein